MHSLGRCTVRREGQMRNDYLIYQITRIAELERTAQHYRDLANANWLINPEFARDCEHYAACGELKATQRKNQLRRIYQQLAEPVKVVQLSLF